MTIPENYINTGISNADIVFFVTGLFEESTYLAYAAYCPNYELTLPNKRPTLAYVNFNTKYLSQVFNTDKWLTWIDVTIHEITHALVFSPNHFPNFVRYPNSIIVKNGRSWINAANIVASARDHFGCPSLTEVPLEDNGG